MSSGESVSMYSVTPDVVRHIGQLAALELDAASETRFVNELNRILDYMKQLNALDTDGIEATFQTFPNVNVMREDRVTPSLSQEAVLQNAPEKEGSSFKVPPILGGDTSGSVPKS